MRYKITTLKNTTPYSYHLWAKSKEEAIQKAQRNDGIPPIHLQENPLISPPIAPKDIFLSLKQFELMISANLPLQACLNSLKKHSSNKRLAQIFENIALSLENGLSLYESFLPYRSIFGNLSLTMIRFGSQSGNLSLCLKLLLNELKQQEKHKKEIQKALFYPCFVLVCTLICFWFLLHLLVPQFAEIFAQNQIDLPIYTQILIIVQEGIAHYGLFIFIVFIGLIFFLTLQFKTKGLLYQPLLSLALHLPLIGKILLNSYFHRYFFTLSILFRAGLDLQSCISLAQESIPSMQIQNKLSSLQNALINGKDLATAFQENKLFDSFTLNLIQIAQQSGNLEEILQSCADNFQNKSRDQIALIISLIEPSLTLLLGIFILFLALGIFVPIWNLS